jgi:hypothetical protein
MGVDFDEKLTGSVSFSHNITITIDILTTKTTMNNFQLNLMTGQKPTQKPSGNVLTEAFRITVSRIRDVRH